MGGVRVVAYAKVNLSLEVLGKRGDGFHEVRSVIQSLEIADEVCLEEAPQFSISCDLPVLASEDNLVVKAIGLLAGSHALDTAVSVRLRKSIPFASGLGGASADAAAALVAFDAVRRADLAARDLTAAAALLGSDVPFFLNGGTAEVSGRGEIVRPLSDLPTSWLVLLVPSHAVERKTATLYRLLSPDSWSTGERTDRLATAISRGDAAEPSLLGNCFEAVADAAFPSLPSYRAAMLAAGCESVHLSGAGPSLFSLFEREKEARSAAKRLVSSGFQPIVARTLSSAEARPRPLPPA